MFSFYYEFRRIFCGFNYILTKIISLGEVVFPYFQIGRFEGGVLSELMRLYQCAAKKSIRKVYESFYLHILDIIISFELMVLLWIQILDAIRCPNRKKKSFLKVCGIRAFFSFVSNCVIIF